MVSAGGQAQCACRNMSVSASALSLLTLFEALQTIAWATGVNKPVYLIDDHGESHSLTMGMSSLSKGKIQES